MSDFTLLPAVGVLGWTLRRGAGGDGSSGCSLPLCGHPDPPHVAAAAAAAAQWRRTVRPERRPAQSAGLPFSLPLQTGHQPQDHPRVSHMGISSYCCRCVEMCFVFLSLQTAGHSSDESVVLSESYSGSESLSVFCTSIFPLFHPSRPPSRSKNNRFTCQSLIRNKTTS